MHIYHTLTACIRNVLHAWCTGGLCVVFLGILGCHRRVKERVCEESRLSAALLPAPGELGTLYIFHCFGSCCFVSLPDMPRRTSRTKINNNIGSQIKMPCGAYPTASNEIAFKTSIWIHFLGISTLCIHITLRRKQAKASNITYSNPIYPTMKNQDCTANSD